MSKNNEKNRLLVEFCNSRRVSWFLQAAVSQEIQYMHYQKF